VSLPSDIINGLTFEKGNPTWKAVMILINASIESEVVDAISKDSKGEDRAWHSGRASALTSFRELLINTRDQVLADQGKAPEKYESGEIGLDS
jgi:hypothetical protein